VAPDQIRFEDTAVNMPEHRADPVLLLGEEGDPARWGWHLECQTAPDTSVMDGWLVKNALFNARLPVPVILTVVSLTRGNRATFPDTYRREGGGHSNEFRFDTLRLWEYADAIRSGEYPELAPLLVLCEDKPTEATLQRERELILGLTVSRAVQVDMLAVAVTVGVRYFARDLLEAVFQKEIGMLKEVEFIRDLFAEELAEGEARGRTEGEARAARRLLLRALQEKFGELSEAVVERVEQANPAECDEIAVRLVRGQSLAEMGLSENGSRDGG
jgi:hypothetical protein